MPERVIASGPRNAKLMIVGMAPAAEEIATGVPFMGPAGQILNRSLERLDSSRKEVRVSNVHDSFLSPGASLFSLPRQQLDASVLRLRREIEEVRPNVVMALGDEPLYFLTGLRGIQKWRGSILSSSLVPGQKIVPSVHTAWIVRGMRKWEPVFTYIDLARALQQSTFPEIILPKRTAITGPSLNTVLDYIEECERHDILSFDIEVYGYTATGAGEIACTGISYKIDEALCIPFVRSGGMPYWNVSDEAKVWKAIARLLQNPRIRKVGQNLSFEWIYFWLHHIYPRNMWIDTMLLHHTLYPDWGGTEDVWGRKRASDEPGHSLAFINSQYTESPYYKDDGRRWVPGMGDHQFWRYNCMDVMVTLECALKMWDECAEVGLRDFYDQFQRRPFLKSVRMEWFGVAVDISKRAAASIELAEQAASLQKQINERLGYSLNVNSPKQMYKLLYEDLKLKVVKRVRKQKDGSIKKTATADKDAIRKFAESTQNEVLLWIMDLRHTLDLKGDIVDQHLGVDGRMHSHYKQGGTDSNRWSSTKSILGTGTNLQNIPRDGIARHLFIAS